MFPSGTRVLQLLGIAVGIWFLSSSSAGAQQMCYDACTSATPCDYECFDPGANMWITCGEWGTCEGGGGGCQVTWVWEIEELHGISWVQTAWESPYQECTEFGVATLHYWDFNCCDNDCKDYYQCDLVQGASSWDPDSYTCCDLHSCWGSWPYCS